MTMNHNEAPNMQQSYPSPNAVAADNGGPFYSSTQNPQQSANLSTPEELQLAAQLSRNMAPNMNANTIIDGLPVQDPRAQQGVNQQYQQDHQAHAIHDQRQVQQQHANNAPMDQMAAQYGSPIPDESAAGRKRSKVSRACDECRRKKIRCDATDESGDGVPCSNCKRVGNECQFSRVPMKRGPSKGYIKELADRLNTLEGALQSGDMLTHHDGQYAGRPSEEFSPVPQAAEQGRKRSFSAISNDFGSPYQTQRPAPGWAPQDSARQAFSASQLTGFREPNYSASDMAPVGSWRNAPEANRRQSNTFEDSMKTEQVQAVDRITRDRVAVEGYFTTIHTTFPLLSMLDPESSAKASGPAANDLFFQALYDAVRSFPSQSHLAQIRKVPGKFDHNNRSGNLMQLQTILMQIIEAENYAPIHKAGSPKPSLLLGSAIGLAYSLKLHVRKQPDQTSDIDVDSGESQERRIWWTLVVMDKWHAASTASPVMIPDTCIVFYKEDRKILGECFYHLARLSLVLGHVSAINIAPSDPPSLSASPSPIIGTLLRGELERVREDFPESFFPASNCPLVHLCYWTLRILMELRNPESEPQALLEPAMHLVTQLTYNVEFVSPLTHHATALAALTLFELTGYNKTRAEAVKGLQNLADTRIAPSAWDGVIRDLIGKKLQPAVTASDTIPSAALTASQGLQRLADLATATEDKKGIEQSANSPNAFEYYHDLRETVRKGYLSAFLGDVNTK